MALLCASCTPLIVFSSHFTCSSLWVCKKLIDCHLYVCLLAHFRYTLHGSLLTSWRYLEDYWGLQKAEKQSFSVPPQVQKSPGLDELRVRNSPCCTAHNLWFSVLRTSSRDASAVGTSLDSIIQPAAEGNHRPQVPGLMLTVQHSQTRHQPSWKVMLDKEGAWLGSSSSITPQATGDSN